MRAGMTTAAVLLAALLTSPAAMAQVPGVPAPPDDQPLVTSGGLVLETPPDLVVDSQALPWGELLGNATRRQVNYAVVMVPSFGQMPPTLERDLSRGVVESLRRYPGARGVELGHADALY